MVTIFSLHLLFIGIYFLIVSQVAPFSELLLSFMLIIGIILVFLGIIFRIIKTVGMKIKKAMVTEEKLKQKVPVPKKYYLTYFLIFLAFILTLYGLMTIESPFLADHPQIPQNDMFCWTQWYMNNRIIDEGKLILSLRSAISMFGSDFDIADREITITHHDEETIISIGGSWTKDKVHHEKLTSVIKDHIGDSKIIRDDIIVCT